MKAQDIKTGDTFVAEGKVVWRAISDAEIVTVPKDFRLVRVIIQFETDGGREPRYWDIDYDVAVVRDGLKTVYVVEEVGATFTFTDLDEALAELKAEIVGHSDDVTFRIVQAPASLEGDELADWVASNG